ncbi:MAG: putative sulfate/molybdate transporter [Pirellulaceae bacterium]|nr:putative sulfate/molybdate transporter [Pirellulaceae bacterium]
MGESEKASAADAVTGGEVKSAWRVWSVLRQAKFNRNEIAGSLGDLGTFLPLLVGMSVQNGLNFASALFFAGLFNVVTGLTFAIPMAVQPMKAIAAVALTEGLTVPQILAAGASVSLIILILGLTGLIDWLNRVIPRSVVRGLQLALGLSLLMKGMQMVAGTNQWIGFDSYGTGLAAAIAVLLLFFSRRVPAAMILFGAGLLIAVGTQPEILGTLGIGLTLPSWSPPHWNDFVTAFPRATLPQIPLTTLNSVIAVCALSCDLFPGREASPRKVAMSVGAMNLIACWFGGMPMCHGAGGLAGQYRFGARTNGSILFLGCVKMGLALLFGGSLITLCAAFPASILGVLLAFAGMELALVCRDQTSRTDAFAMLLTAAACMGLNNIALGFALGLVMAWCLRLGLVRVDEGLNES